MDTLNIRITSVIIAILYYGAGSFGLLWAVEGTSATALWPPAGIAAAAMLVFGPRVWMGVFVGAFAANFAHFISLDQLSQMTSVLASAAIAAGNSCEALAFYYLTTSLIGKSPLDEVKGVFKFVPVVLISCLIAAAVGLAVMLVTGLETLNNAGEILITWWFGDALAILILVPLLTSWWPLPKWRLGYKWFELFAAFASLVLLCELLFLQHVTISVLSSRPMVVVPVLVWLTFRFSRREVVIALGLITICALYGTSQGVGALVENTMSESFLSAQLYCALLMMTTLTLSAMITQMIKDQRKLARSNEDLENIVAKRTKELQRKTGILMVMNNQLRIEARERIAAEKKWKDLQTKGS